MWRAWRWIVVAAATVAANKVKKKPPPPDVVECWRSANVTDMKPLAVPLSSRDLAVNVRPAHLAGTAPTDAWRPLFGGVVDVLQVTKEVDCLVVENVRRTRALYHPSGLLGKHVIITPDAAGCATLATTHHLEHVVCLGEDAVFGSTLTLRQVNAAIEGLGPEGKAKGGAWYWQQFLKLGAVSMGSGGLGERVRIMDGDSLSLKPLDWFDKQGREIFDTGRPPGRRGAYGNHGDFNDLYYGHNYYALTGEHLIGGANVITHGLSITRNHTHSMLRALANGGVSVGVGVGGKEPNQATKGMMPGNERLRHPQWVWAVLGAMCPATAPLGFSEYWNYVSHSVAHLPSEVAIESRPAPWIRYKAAHDCGKDEASHKWRSVAEEMALTFPGISYIVLEDHSAARGVPTMPRKRASPKGGGT